MIHFSQIRVGGEYDRPTLARMWGYATHHAISRGVITPAGQSLIVLFVTRYKQESLTQYEDHIDLDTLFWEGELAHGTDNRIVSRKDEIHVFYRERHHALFIYEGLAKLNFYRLYSDRPSKFEFILLSRALSSSAIVAQIQQSYGMSITEKEALVKARIGQGLFRKQAIQLWGSCAVTGCSKSRILIASHIKPWKLSLNDERISAYNSLLLIPTLDKVFDLGYLSFESNGKVILSDRISEDNWSRLNISKDMILRKIPDETRRFLEYHREYRFDMRHNL